MWGEVVGGRCAPSPIRAAGVEGWLGVSNSGRRGAGNRRRPPSFSGLSEIPIAHRRLSSFSLLAELSFRPCGSPRSRSVSFCPPLRLSSLGSFLFTVPRRGGGSDFPSLCPISSLCTRSTLQFGARRLLYPKSEEGEPSRLPPLLSARRRDAPGVMKSPVWHLFSSRGAVFRIVPASRGATGRGRSVAGIAAFPEDLPAFLYSVFSL